MDDRTQQIDSHLGAAADAELRYMNAVTNHDHKGRDMHQAMMNDHFEKALALDQAS